MPAFKRSAAFTIAALATVLIGGQATAADALVNADWLQKNLDNPKVRVFELSVDTGIYERGHIPGAKNSKSCCARPA